MTNNDIRDNLVWANNINLPTELKTAVHEKSDMIIQALNEATSCVISFTREEISKMGKNFDTICDEIIDENNKDKTENGEKDLNVKIRFAIERSTISQSDEDNIEIIYMLDN